MAHLEAARDLRPHDSRILNNLGVAYLRSGQPERAEPLLRAALREDQRDVALRQNNLGMALAMQGRFDEALEAFRRAGDEQSALSNLGYAHYARGGIRPGDRAVREGAARRRPGERGGGAQPRGRAPRARSRAARSRRGAAGRGRSAARFRPRASIPARSRTRIPRFHRLRAAHRTDSSVHLLQLRGEIRAIDAREDRAPEGESGVDREYVSGARGSTRSRSREG